MFNSYYSRQGRGCKFLYFYLQSGREQLKLSGNVLQNNKKQGQTQKMKKRETRKAKKKQGTQERNKDMSKETKK